MIASSKIRSRLVLPAHVLAGGMLLGAAFLPARASAQTGFNNFNGAPTGPVVGSAEDKGGKREAAPPALPGTRTQKTEPAPAQSGAGDLPPTEALFDSINRGDILTARDAVNRGADLNGRNVLGMSPLDLSIDLGRNEITFLLLSLRPATPRDGGPAPALATKATTAARTDPRRGGKATPVVAESDAAPAPAPTTPQQRRADRTAQARNGRQPVEPRPLPQPAPQPAQVAEQAAPAAPQPRQFANQRGESGTPIPQMGFLGFGSVTR